jgi:hypothetical protein
VASVPASFPYSIFLLFRLTCSHSSVYDDQELYVYEAQKRRDDADKEVARYAQRLAREHDDEVQRRIDTTRQHFWCMQADTYDKWMHRDNCAYSRDRA